MVLIFRMTLREALTGIANKTHKFIECNDDYPQVIVVGTVNYSPNQTEEMVINCVKPSVVLHEDLVDSKYYGKEDRWEAGDFYNFRASESKRKQITECVGAVRLAKDCGFNVIGADLTDRRDETTREFNFYNMAIRYLHKAPLVLIVGFTHANPNSQLVNLLKKNGIKFALIYY
jgi:hypothetical protein